MSKDPNCMYCALDERVDNLMIKVADLQVSTLYLFKEQSHPGRCILAFNKSHKGEIFQLTPEEQAPLMNDLAKASGAVQQVFQPDKLNYASFGDKGPHIHFHIVPKYKDKIKWGEIFDMMPEKKVYWKDLEYTEKIEALKGALK